MKYPNPFKKIKNRRGEIIYRQSIENGYRESNQDFAQGYRRAVEDIKKMNK